MMNDKCLSRLLGDELGRRETRSVFIWLALENLDPNKTSFGFVAKNRRKGREIDGKKQVRRKKIGDHVSNAFHMPEALTINCPGRFLAGLRCFDLVGSCCLAN